MINREKMKAYIDVLNEICTSYNDLDFGKSVSDIYDLNENYNIKVLLVGHFNSGKSALINGLIGRSEFLKEAQSPQTALAAELRYTDGDEKLYAVDNNGKVTEFDIDSELEAEKYIHCEYYLNSPILEKLKDYVVVDTPGFDSGIENHNKALMNYISSGAAFLLVIDGSNGGLNSNDIAFLGEVTQYSEKTAVIINKCDKLTDDNIEAVRTLVETTLDINGYDCEVYCTSKFDEDISDKLAGVINSFDPQEIYERSIKSAISGEAASVREILKSALDGSYLDVFELDKKINDQEHLIDSVKRTFECKRNQANNDLLENGVESIMAEVLSAMDGCLDSVTNAVIGGSPDGAQAVIMNAVRPVIMRNLKTQTSAQISDIVMDIKSGAKQTSENTNVLNIVTGITSNVNSLIENGTFDSLKKGIEKHANTETKSSKARKVYQGIASGLAILTDVIAPWMEIIVVLLPNIADGLKALFGDSERDKVRKNISSCVYPQITGQMRTMVEQCVEESYNALLDHIEAEFNEKTALLTSEMENLKKLRTEQQDSYEDHVEKLKNDINELDKLISELE